MTSFQIARVISIVVLCTGCGSHVHAGAGLGMGRTSVGGEQGSAFGPVVSLRMGVPDRAVGGLVTLDVQPFRVQHPYADEAFRIAYLLPALQVNVRPVMLRAGVGAAFSTWSGSDAVTDAEIGLAIGAGIELALNPTHPVWLIDLSVRSATTSDFEMGMNLFSLQLSRRVR